MQTSAGGPSRLPLPRQPPVLMDSDEPEACALRRLAANSARTAYSELTALMTALPAKVSFPHLPPSLPATSRGR